MKKVLFELHSTVYFHVDFVVYFTPKCLVIDYYVNRSGQLVGKSFFHKFKDSARILEIKKVINYWVNSPLTAMAILLDEFFGAGYKNKLRYVF